MSSVNYVLEVLGANDKVVDRWMIDQWPAHIGRSYNNSVILDDEFCAPIHARLVKDAEGRVIIENMSTINGLIDDQQRKIDRALIVDEWMGMIGQTLVRIRPQNFDFPVERKLADRRAAWEAVGHLGLKGWVTMVFSVVLALSTVGINAYLDSPLEIKWDEIVTQLLLTFGVLVVWSGVWNLLGNLLGGGKQFGRHIRLVSLGITGVVVLLVATEWVAYATGWVRINLYSGVLAAVTLVVLLYQTLRILPVSKKPAFAISGMLAITLAFVYINNNRFKPYYQNAYYFGVLKPPQVRISKPKDLDTFLQDVQQLGDELSNE